MGFEEIVLEIEEGTRDEYKNPDLADFSYLPKLTKKGEKAVREYGHECVYNAADYFAKALLNRQHEIATAFDVQWTVDHCVQLAQILSELLRYADQEIKRKVALELFEELKVLHDVRRALGDELVRI
jgi:alcohol dehydrogenase class IV